MGFWGLGITGLGPPKEVCKGFPARFDCDIKCTSRVHVTLADVDPFAPFRV